MTTVVNTPPSNDGSGSATGIILGVLLAIVLIILFIVYGIPAIRQNPEPEQQPGTTNIIVTPPATNNSPSNP